MQELAPTHREGGGVQRALEGTSFPVLQSGKLADGGFAQRWPFVLGL